MQIVIVITKLPKGSNKKVIFLMAGPLRMGGEGGGVLELEKL